jgi:hypothetical protein
LTVSAFGQSSVCESAEAKAFDWQIGVWQSEDGKQVHEIKKLLDSCVIQETWKTEGIETAVALKSFDDGRHNKTGEKKMVLFLGGKTFSSTLGRSQRRRAMAILSELVFKWRSGFVAHILDVNFRR